MQRSLDITVIGGDIRQAYLAELFHNDGNRVSVYALERHPVDGCNLLSDLQNLENQNAIILPMPLLHGAGLLNAPLSNRQHSLDTLLDDLPPHILTLAGAVPFWVHARAVRNELHLIDYLLRDDLAIINAIPTCEGVIQLAMEQTPFTICGSRCLVIGYGRVGSMLAQKLQALGAQVTVAARNARDFAKIKANGLCCIDSRNLTGVLHPFSLIFNTVPAAILGSAELSSIEHSCLIIDLASLPGGIDCDSPLPSGCRVIQALSLPGKVAPLSAAQAIHDTALHIMQEEKLI